ncbi:hypothetical protein AHF37_06802 [Paragonimus kellicotti]|nr:hypothetical protein AHF37_06802 [Paragonimus kellicotti]
MDNLTFPHCQLTFVRELTVKDLQACTARQSERTQTMDRPPPEPLGSDSDLPDVKRNSRLVLSSGESNIQIVF